MQKALGAWILDLRKNLQSNRLAFSAVLIGRIWRRYYFNAKKIEEKNRNKGLMQYIELCIVAFLNAVFVEEVFDAMAALGSHGARDGLDIIYQNTTTSPHVFFEKIRKYVPLSSPGAGGEGGAGEIAPLPLTRALVSCPMVRCFLYITKEKDNQKSGAAKNTIESPEDFVEKHRTCLCAGFYTNFINFNKDIEECLVKIAEGLSSFDNVIVVTRQAERDLPPSDAISGGPQSPSKP